MPYVENTEKEEERSLHSFELEFESGKSEEQTQSVNQIVARIMAKNGYEKGKGLGLQLQGTQSPVTLPENKKRHGLGYEATLGEEMENLVIDDKERRRKGKVKHIPHLRETFPSPAEIVMAGEVVRPRLHLTINTLGEDLKKDDAIRPARGDELMSDWRSETLIDVIAMK